MSIIVLFFLLVTSSVFRTTRAQSPPAPLVTHVVSNGAAAPRATFPMLLIIFVFALFITAFCSIYIRYCSYQQPHALPQSAPRGCGIDPRVLATCPVMSYSAARMKTPQNAAFQCAVCLVEFDDADSLRLLPKCGHVFHPACIDTWLAAHVTCPVCRGEVSVEIEEETRARHMLNESSARGFGFGVLLRSHSTGHSLERFTLRLPKEVTKNILENGERGSVITRMKRSASYDVVLRSVEGGEGSSNSNSKGKSNYNDNNQWVLSMTPSFVSRGSDSSNVGTACPGILRFWGASVVREEKECQGRTVFRCAVGFGGVSFCLNTWNKTEFGFCCTV